MKNKQTTLTSTIPLTLISYIQQNKWSIHYSCSKVYTVMFLYPLLRITGPYYLDWMTSVSKKQLDKHTDIGATFTTILLNERRYPMDQHCANKSYITNLQITHTLHNHTYKLILVVQNIFFLHALQLMDYSHPVITKIHAILQILRIKH